MQSADFFMNIGEIFAYIKNLLYLCTRKGFFTAMTNSEFWKNIDTIIARGFNTYGLKQLEEYAELFISGRLVYKRFSPLEQHGCATGGSNHVIASLLAGASVDASSLTAPEGSFQRERDMLTETRNKHFSERLFYADSLSLLPQSVAPCSNGNIAAARISQSDSIYTFAYSYDPLNRLTSSVRIADAGTSPSEQFSYDASGNIIFLTRYNGRQKIDSLVCRYKNDGNQLVTVTDEGNDDDTYEVIEYHTEDMLADTSMWYDANGNLVYDEDRGISVIHYNVLNLPDTVQFINGNQIVNLYDAAGRKYKSITYIVPETAVTPRYEIMQYGFDIDTVEYMITEYAGTIENHYSRIDTTRRIHNAIGYYTNNAYYHYIKDHLGSVCAVVHSTADTLIQGTIYYASGIPMAYSFGRDKQPYLYNSKEFVEAHGYNTYDYGFRGYYATIGRFTTIDPLAEQTPWLSPYAYAGNWFVNAIDWMGLGGMTGYNLTGVNSSGVVVYHDDSVLDHRVFLVGDDWKEGDPVTNGLLVGWEIWGVPYKVGARCDYLCLGGGSIFSGEFGTGIPRSGLNDITYNFSISDSPKQISEEYNAFEGIAGYVNMKNFMDCNLLIWQGANGRYYNVTQLKGKGQYCFQNSFKKAAIRGAKGPWGVLGTGLSLASLGIAANDMWQNGITVGNTIDAVVAGAGVFGGVAAFGVLGAGALACSPWVITAVTIYGIADFGVYLYTGHSITDW